MLTCTSTRVIQVGISIPHMYFYFLFEEQNNMYTLCIIKLTSCCLLLFLQACSFSTQAICTTTLPNSYCDLGSLLCECSTAAGYVENADGSGCQYSKLLYVKYKIRNKALKVLMEKHTYMYI